MGILLDIIASHIPVYRKEKVSEDVWYNQVYLKYKDIERREIDSNLNTGDWVVVLDYYPNLKLCKYYDLYDADRFMIYYDWEKTGNIFIDALRVSECRYLRLATEEEIDVLMDYYLEDCYTSKKDAILNYYFSLVKEEKYYSVYCDNGYLFCYDKTKLSINDIRTVCVYEYSLDMYGKLYVSGKEVVCYAVKCISIEKKCSYTVSIYLNRFNAVNCARNIMKMLGKNEDSYFCMTDMSNAIFVQ